MGMQLIETIEVGSGGAASIEFTSIPQDGVDLLLVLSLRTTGTDVPINIRLNNDTASNYSYIRLIGSGSSASSAGNTISAAQGGFASTSSYTSNTYGNTQLYFSNYTSSSAKSMSADSVTENNATLSYQFLGANSWSGTSAIDTILIYPNSLNWEQYSTASLYKITAD